MPAITNENGETLLHQSSCQNDAAYLSGLKEGEYVTSVNPYYYQDENGIMVGVNATFAEFIVMNQDGKEIGRIDTAWQTSCKVSYEAPQQIISSAPAGFKASSADSFKGAGILIVITLSALFLIILWKGRKRCSKNG